MTTVPGTYFTKEQLEAARKADDVSGGGCTGSNKMSQFGFVYTNGKEQYDKALAWYILAAMENNTFAQHGIGVLYYFGYGVPQNYLCALKWFLKSTEQSGCPYTPESTGLLFENGYGVPLDKYRALEWYCHGGDKSYIKTLKDQGYHRSATDKKKSLEQLRMETEVILDAEKKKLEQKQHKTQEEMKALVDVNITYKLVDGGKMGWQDVPILSADDKQRYTKPINGSVTNNENEILELKKQIQLLKQDKNTLEDQAKQLESLKQEKINFELRIREKDKELVSLRNDKQSLQQGNSTVQQDMKAKDSKINSLQSENQELKLKISSLEHQLDEKDSKFSSLLTEIKSLKQEKITNEYQLKEKDNKMNSLENENRIHRTSSLAQTQTLQTLNHEKATLEQNKTQASIEIERLKASNTSLEQLLKSKEDATASLNGENKNLSSTNQFIIEMVETQKSLLQAKTNETELLRQNMELLLANERQRNDTLEQENQLLKQERNQYQTNVQNTGHLNSNRINHANVRSSHDGDDDNAHNDINYDSELDNTDDDINYDTPSEDEEK